MHPKKLKHHDTRHHRKPTSLLGKTEQRNISVVPKNKHEAWHLLFSNNSPEEIASIINRVWLDPDYHFTCNRVGWDDD